MKKLNDLLFIQKLNIPEYQRPYKWQVKHVKQLIEDIVLHQNKSAYRIGTAVLHLEDDKLNVVDGQQRLITLSLIAYVLCTNEKTKEFAFKYGKNTALTLINNSVNNSISKKNIVTNFNEIEREVRNFTEDEIRFFFTKCELVCITLTSISEAFQFFDSQNARGKDLAPHDLLKAFHLREMGELSEKERQQCIQDWENKNDDDLNEVFSQYLFRIRKWSKRKPGRYLNKANAAIFKGISLNKTPDFPYIYPLKINNIFTNEYNQHIHRKVDNNKKKYPFQIDQVVINGQRFFEMIAFYQEKINNIKQTHKIKWVKKDNNTWEIDENDFLKKLNFLDINLTNCTSFKIFKTLASYEGRKRSGDQYVRTLFDCALLYYTDKFGNQDLDRVLIKLFIWSYSLRLNHHSVQLASVDNYAIHWNSIFWVIRDAIQPKEVYQIFIENIDTIKSSKTSSINEMFTELKYYNGK
ncbi:hypothetical protein WH52_07205 [Tenacibaculum holothuriorum]|uniref:Uncharacterized protein n=1 Tax=Tenacibaculum holothuriorum TaxID=1635173 RepID=A0A1Y2PFW1_9FLAO|nr:hypothetical protein WH52_07205 [Tenacibaculum holothuriorum]